jgi:hypothetical protein
VGEVISAGKYFPIRVVLSAERNVQLILGLLAERGEEKTGGYFCLVSKEQSRQILAVIQFGSLSAELATQYSNYVLEKVERLDAHPDTLASHETRDEAKHRFGGAIRASGYLLSFSGFTEDADEALVLLVAMEKELLTQAEALDIARRTGNTFFTEQVLPRYIAAR